MTVFKKSILALLLLGSTVASYGQTSVYDFCPVSAVPDAALTSAPNEHLGICFDFEEGTTYNHPAGVDEEFKASGHIKVSPNFKMGSSATNPDKFRLASLEAHDVALFEPNDLFAVKRYERFELGVELPEALQTGINSFIADPSAPDAINPFLEWEIDVKATYIHVATGTIKTVNGFYFEDFERVPQEYTGPNPISFLDTLSYSTWGGYWQNLGTEGYPFRIRFAPPLNGEWIALLTVTTPSTGTYNYPEFIFNVVESGNPGYIQVGSNNRFFTRGSETFIPAGPNFGWPETLKELHPIDYPIFGGSLTEKKRRVKAPLKSFINFENDLQKIADEGANCFRYMLSPWGGDIEFEEIGNYHKRLNYAYEIDRMVNLCENEDLTIYFNMMVHYNLETNAFGFKRWDWADGDEYLDCLWDETTGTFVDLPEIVHDQQFCYHRNPEFALDKPELFFTDVDARKYYKQKLRYMVARWGYSTSVGMWELISEVNNIGAITADKKPDGTEEQMRTFPYKDALNINNIGSVAYRTNVFPSSGVFQKKVEEWHDEMTKYINNTLGDAHPISASYAGSSLSGDNTHGLSSIGHVSENHYNHGRETKWFHKITNPSGGLIEELEVHGKPVVFAETGVPYVVSCDDIAIELQRTLWMNTFSGLAAGLGYGAARQPDHWHYYKELLDFVDGEDFNGGNWIPGQHIGIGSAAWNDMARADETADMVYLRSGDKNKVMGVINNRTYNYYSLHSDPDGSDCDTKKPEDAVDDLNTVKMTVTASNGGNALRVHGLLLSTQYKIWYYNVNGNVLIDSAITFGPVVKLNHPDLNDDHPIIAFKIKRVPEKKFAVNSINASLYPNPTSNWVNIQWEGDLESEIRITDVSGKLVYSTRTEEKQLRWNTELVEPGVYMVNIHQNKERVFTERLVVQ